MKLPNGYGSVTKLSGNRRKPYLARVTLGWTTDEQTGKTVQNRVPLGTFKTKKEALQALAEYGANPYDIQNASMTLAELYEKWTAAYFATLESESSCRTIKSAWSYCHAIAGMRVKDCVPAISKELWRTAILSLHVEPTKAKRCLHLLVPNPGSSL